VSNIYNVSKSSLQRWVKQIKPEFKKRRKVNEIKKELRLFIEKSLEQNPFLTMETLSKLCIEKCGLKRCSRTLGRYVNKIGWTMKNATRIIDKSHNNNDVKLFCEKYNEASKGNLVCIDECGFYLGDHPKRGYSKKGTKLVIRSQRAALRYKLSVIMAISSQRIEYFEILDHNCKKKDFISFIEKLNLPYGSTLLMDNISFHHSKETIKMMHDKGYKPLYILSYSPRTNSIENVFGVIKPMFRRKCPSFISKTFDYKNLFQETILDFSNKYNLQPFFDKTYRFINETLCDVSTNPDNFRFCGYE
jgi:transposase